jgi:hypothetical protein
LETLETCTGGHCSPCGCPIRHSLLGEIFVNSKPGFDAPDRRQYSSTFSILDGSKGTLLLLLLVACGVFGMASSSAFAARVTMVSAQSAGHELTGAKTALQNGDVVAMQNVKPQSFSGLFNVGLAASRKASDQGGSYCVIGAAYDQRRVLHTYRGELVRAGNSDADCMTRFHKWTDTLSTFQAEADAALQAAVGTSPGTGPPAAAWTALIVNTETDRPGLHHGFRVPFNGRSSG